MTERLNNPMDYSLPGSSIHGIFQTGVLEWGAIAFPELFLGEGPSKALGILVPQPRIKPVSPALRDGFLTHWTTREAPETVSLMRSLHECLPSR